MNRSPPRRSSGLSISFRRHQDRPTFLAGAKISRYALSCSISVFQEPLKYQARYLPNAVKTLPRARHVGTGSHSLDYRWLNSSYSLSAVAIAVLQGTCVPPVFALVTRSNRDSKTHISTRQPTRPVP